MKKSVKKNLMRGVALLMAVVMVATSGVFHSGGWLRATGIVSDSQEAMSGSSDWEVSQSDALQGNTGIAQLNLPANDVSGGDAIDSQQSQVPDSPGKNTISNVTDYTAAGAGKLLNAAATSSAQLDTYVSGTWAGMSYSRNREVTFIIVVDGQSTTYTVNNSASSYNNQYRFNVITPDGYDVAVSGDAERRNGDYRYRWKTVTPLPLHIPRKLPAYPSVVIPV